MSVETMIGAVAALAVIGLLLAIVALVRPMRARTNTSVTVDTGQRLRVNEKVRIDGTVYRVVQTNERDQTITVRRA